MPEEKKKEEFEPLEPSVPMQLVSLLEDAGLVNIAKAGWGFPEAMDGPSFIIPDWLLWAIVFASIAYSAVLLRWV